MLKKNGGITLIALVITIIVLLILAGVSIAMLTGENGLMGRAANTRIANDIGTAKDLVATAQADGLANYYEKKYSSTDLTAFNAGTDQSPSMKTHPQSYYVGKAINAISSSSKPSAITISVTSDNAGATVQALDATTDITNTIYVKISYSLSGKNASVLGTIALDGSITWGEIVYPE